MTNPDTQGHRDRTMKELNSIGMILTIGMIAFAAMLIVGTLLLVVVPKSNVPASTRHVSSP